MKPTVYTYFADMTNSELESSYNELETYSKGKGDLSELSHIKYALYNFQVSGQTLQGILNAEIALRWLQAQQELQPATSQGAF